MDTTLRTDARHTSPEAQCQLRRSIIRLSKAGKTGKEIAGLLDVSEGHVSGTLKAYKPIALKKRGRRKGNTRTLTPNQEQEMQEKSRISTLSILIICTPNYKTKSDARAGGVGYEGHIISAELFSKGNERKFIPIIRKGSATDVMPLCLAGKLGIDLTVAADYEHNYQDLIATLCGTNKKPKLGNKPAYVQLQRSMLSPNTKAKEPIHILGMITDEVTVPKMDGTRGSALYKIPFRLSNHPSELWKKLFLQLWQFPPSFSTMHRPSIASVYGDKIILDGTTIEEVRDTHRTTLVLCVDEANKKEAQIIVEQQREEALEQQRKNQHFDNVNSIAGDIKF